MHAIALATAIIPLALAQEQTITSPSEIEIEALKKALESGNLSEVDISAILGNTTTEGDEATKKTSNGGKDDYTAAFQKLVDLGLPDAKGAQYVNLTFTSNEQKGRNGYSNEYGYYEHYKVKQLGNAWILPASDEKASTHTAIHDGIKTSTVTHKEKRSLFIRLIIGEDDKPQKEMLKASWTKVDPKEEVDAILKQLEENQQLSQAFKAQNWNYNADSMSFLGDLLITACHLHRSGHPTEGNRLARHILTTAPYPFKVIDFTVTKLAEQEYQTLLDSLYEHKDWTPFLAGIRALSKKYPRGWEQQAGLAILIPKVTDLVRKGPSKISPIKGTTLDPEIIATFEQLLSFTEAGAPLTVSAPICWTIDPQGEIKTDYPSRNHPDWIRAIVAKGMDAVPTLLALSTDSTLIPTALQSNSSNYANYNNFSGQGSPDAGEALYKKMQRPCSRGEIARAILLRTLPTDGTGWSNLSPEQFQLAAIDWWKTTKSLSLSQTQISFLETQNSEQQAYAIKALLNSEDEASFDAIETHILSSGSIFNNLDSTKTYLQKRRAKGASFYKKIVSIVEGQIEEMDEDSREDYQKYFDDNIKSLSVLVEEISPEKIIAEIKSGKHSPSEGLSLLQVSLGDDALLENLTDLLPLVATFEKTEDRLTALQSLMTWARKATPQEAFSDDPNAKELSDHQKKSREIAEKHLSLWKTFLARTKALDIDTDPEILTRLASPPSEAHYAASIMQGIHFPDTYYSLQAINQVATPAEVWKIILSRMETFAESQSLPPFPSADLVHDDRRSALLEEIKALPTLEIPPFRESINITERLAVSEIIAELEELPENIAALKYLPQKIDWSRANTIPEDHRQDLEKIILYKEFNTKTIQSLLDYFSKLEVGYLFYIQAGSESISGPSISFTTTQFAGSWLENYIPDELATLDGKKTKSLSALILMDQSSDDGPNSTVTFDPPLDEKAENSAMQKQIAAAIKLLKPSEKEGRRNALIIGNETFAGRQASKEDDEDQ